MTSPAKATTRNHASITLRGVTRDRDRQFRAMFEGAALGMAACTLEGRILETNVAFASLLGYRHTELAGRNVRELRTDETPKKNNSLEQLGHSARLPLKEESRYLRKDGSAIWAQLTASPVRDAASGEPSLLLALLENTTEGKRAAEKAREAEKMEVIGRLAGGIAHDFNNLLTGVLLYCDLLSDGLERDNGLRQHVQEIRLAGEQGAALTQQLLAIARKQVPQPRPISLNEVVVSTENMLRRLIGEQIELITRLAPRLKTVHADPAELRQVLLNLVLNARDALPHGGRITVRTLTKPGNGAAAAVCLVVEDTGCGMDETTRARLFEPFFTTKPEGHGTGLGLATVQRVVSESGGTIDVKSEPGHGTRIEVLLPALAGVAAVSTAKNAARPGQAILLVDDHPSARNSIQRVLHHAGYNVVPAASGKRALKIFAESADEIGLLLADWMMPGMTGRELAEKLVRQKPQLKVLLISGYHDLREGPAVDSVELIRKPFAGRVLLERIRDVLDSKGAASW